MQKTPRNPVVLVVLDGWGIASPGQFNAITLAKTTNFDRLKSEYGAIDICASGKCVGLAEGQMGNSEVGHLTIGAGRVVLQDVMRINEEIEDDKLQRNPKLLGILKKVNKRDSTLHFIGLLSDGGVHSHINHLFTLLQVAKENKVKKIAVHVILDGRDTPPKSGINYVKSLLKFLEDLNVGNIATVSGRYYAMDRDNRWERTKLAYDSIVYAEGPRFDDATFAVQNSYEKGVNDEFVEPRVIGSYEGMKNDDAIIIYNFRPDRVRQITKALSFTKKEFGDLFDRDEKRRLKKLDIVTMTIYDTNFHRVKPLLGRERISNTLSNVLERNAIRQLRVAETEKYAHVTYFFNGLIEKPRKYEDRILVPSLREVGTYDKKPEMSAKEITSKAVKEIESGKYGFILINFANADMVGHSGNVSSTVKGVETVDECLGNIFESWKKLNAKDSTLIITADHGNAEKMFDEKTQQPHTAHTSNPVPFIVISRKWKVSEKDDKKAGLSDIAPSILKIMQIDTPREMTGKPIVERL